MTSIAESSIFVEASEAPVSSPDGLHIASFHATYLEIRRTKTLEVIRRISVSGHAAAKFLCIRWSPVGKGMGLSSRILYADEETVRVWDLHDFDWSAVIDNGTGNMGKLVNVEFGCDDTEILVFSAFGSKANIWSLWTGANTELRDPKFAFRGHGRSRHGRNGIFALLTRPGPQDVMTLHISGAYATLKTIMIPSVDAQGLKWSPDGRWVVVWDTPSTGYKIFIYTADGHLYRTYNGDYYDDGLAGLGVRSIEWSPTGDCLAIGNYERYVTLLSTRTFSPAVHLSHKSSIQLSSGIIWQEKALSSTDREYHAVTQRFNPPSAKPNPVENELKCGISVVAFNTQGTYLATKDESMPTTVWIWDLTRLKAAAVLVQHSTVKRLLWHPTNQNLLLIQCNQDETILYSWTARGEQPQIIQLRDLQLSRKAEAQWIDKGISQKPVFLLGDARGYVLGFPEGREQPSPSIDASQPTFDGEQSTDSLFEVLTGRKGVSRAEREGDCHGDRQEGIANDVVQDTFQFRHSVRV